MSDFEMVTVPERQTAVLHETVPMNELPKFFQRAYGEVYSALQAEGLKPAGPPFSLYFGMPTDKVELEVGFPVEEKFTELGDVHASTLPGGKCVHGLHIGPYETMVQTYGEMTKWLVDHHLVPSNEMWEVYMSDPQKEPDPKTWRTEIYWPVN